MSQISLPWIERSPQTLKTYREKAIRRLLLGAAGLLVVAALSALVLTKLAGTWTEYARPIIFFLVVIGLLLTGIGLIAIGFFQEHPIHALVGVALSGLGLTHGALLQLTPIDPLVLGALVLVVGPLAGAGTLFAAGTVVLFYRPIVWLLRRRLVPFALFISGLVGTTLVVWAHALLFRYVDGLMKDSAVNGLATSFAGGALTIDELLGHFSGGYSVFAYALWPLQFQLVRDLVALGGIVGFISLIPAFGIWWERTVAARIQSRMGPMRVGGWHGWLQSPADGIKLIFKEDIIPPEGDPILFRLAPYLAFVPAVLAFIALPFAGAWVFRDLDVALIFILAMLGIEVVGVIVAGWASNNKWAVYGSMREACQMVSYEIPMGMALLIPVMTAGSLQLTAIANAQAGGYWNWLVFANPWCFIAFFAYYCAALASCKRAPFDLPESESELVAGFLTEYTGFRWSLFFFGEYAAMYIVSGLAVILFLGGWMSPFPQGWAPEGTGFVATVVRGAFFDGPILFVLKATALFYVQMWIRWTLPRVRIDQVLYACVQVLLPLVMVVLLANTFWILGVRHLQWAWLVALDGALHWALVAIGSVVALVILAIAVYGYRNRDRLVGSLGVQMLPGA